MVIDSSALVAILTGEPEEDQFLEAMNSASRLLLSAVTLVETAAALLRNGLDDIEHKLDPFLDRAGIEIIPVDDLQARLAREAYRRYGRARHKAALNFGDCFPYALAIAMDEALLFKGNDFVWTDVRKV